MAGARSMAAPIRFSISIEPSRPGAPSGLEHRARGLGVQHQPPEPIVKGRHILELGVTAGPRVGEVLRQIYEQQLDGRVQTLDDGLSLAREIIGAAAPGRSE